MYVFLLIYKYWSACAWPLFIAFKMINSSNKIRKLIVEWNGNERKEGRHPMAVTCHEHTHTHKKQPKVCIFRQNVWNFFKVIEPAFSVTHTAFCFNSFAPYAHFSRVYFIIVIVVAFYYRTYNTHTQPLEHSRENQFVLSVPFYLVFDGFMLFSIHIQIMSECVRLFALICYYIV